jgi:Flp pilus assembly protein TadG
MKQKAAARKMCTLMSEARRAGSGFQLLGDRNAGSGYPGAGEKPITQADTVVRAPLGEKGSGLVEFALASSILFSMVFGILQMCLAFYTYDYISEAAREGTRWAMVRGSTSCTNTPGLAKCNALTTDISNFVKGLGYPGIDATDYMTVTTTYWNPDGTACTSGTCNAPGNAVQTQVAYAFSLSIPFWKVTTLNMSSTSRVLISQ